VASSDVLQKRSRSETSSFEPLTKDEVKALVASGLQDLVLSTDIETAARELGCTTKTVRAALAHDNLLEADKLGNLMARRPHVFRAWFSRLGLRLSYENSEMTPDMHTLAHVTHLGAVFAAALEDGSRSPRETLEIAKVAEALMPRLTAICHDADELRKPRAVRA
jgi:hypothetical protein